MGKSGMKNMVFCKDLVGLEARAASSCAPVLHHASPWRPCKAAAATFIGALRGVCLSLSFPSCPGGTAGHLEGWGWS